MPRVHTEMHLIVEADSESEDGMHFFLMPEENKYYIGSYQINLGKVPTTYTRPDELSDNDIRKAAIRTLKDRQKENTAKTYKDNQTLQGRIDKLLLLTYNVDSGATEVKPESAFIIEECDDEGCLHYGTKHSHLDDDDGVPF